jgi:hypothetical protein
MRINCFVAIAFRDELENVYKNGIELALLKSNVEPIRVDKIVHNERIDFKIRHEIELSEFMIADLTYERPSVYWEAGFAERESQVIYTCREDHLIDGSGHIVHFDLRNANIIPWNENKLGEFIDKLFERIELIIKPIRILHERETLLLEAQKIFSALSSQEQEREIGDYLHKRLYELDYKDCVFFPAYPNSSGSWPCFYKRKDSILFIVRTAEYYFLNDYHEFALKEKSYEEHIQSNSLFSFFNSSNPTSSGFLHGNREEFLLKFRTSPDNVYKNSFPIDSNLISNIDSIRKIIIYPNRDTFGINLFKKQYSGYKNDVFDFHLYDSTLWTFYLPSGVEPYVSHEIFILENIKSILEIDRLFSQYYPLIEDSIKTIDHQLFPANMLKL